jgi:chemotaxis protein histidine kinase CheA
LAEILRPAHTLKGVVGFFGTPAATDASRELEALAKNGDATGASAALEKLLQAIHGIQQDLAALLPPAEPQGETDDDRLSIQKPASADLQFSQGK